MRGPLTEPEYVGFLYPPLVMNKHIRKVELCICGDTISWNLFERFSRGTYGFPNVQNVQVKFEWNIDRLVGWPIDPGLDLLLREQWEKFLTDNVGDGIDLQANGELAFYTNSYWTLEEWGLSRDSFDIMENQLRAKIRFGVKKSMVEEEG
jgi:hypothetical protein